MKRFLIILLTAVALNSVAMAVCNKTTVADTVYYGTGDVLSGTIKITNPMTITGADGCVVPANTVQSASVVAGAFSIALIPNSGSSPTGTYYKATYNVSGTPFTETWTVPASGPQTLSGVRALTPPVPTAMITASQLNPPSPCTSNQVMTWNGTNWTCASAAGSVASVFGRNGTVTAQNGDYTAAQVTNAESTANKNAASGYAGLDSGSRILKAQAPSATVYTDQANTYTAGMKQTFGASATTAGEGFGGVVADPSGAVAGDRWYRTDLNCMRIFTSAAHCVMFTDGAIAIGQTPLTTRGDLMTVNSGGALARVAIGGANTLLHGGTDPAYSAVAIGDVTGSIGTGLFVFATSPTVTDATVNQAANGDNLLFGKRFTDTSPTGNLIYFQNAAANADLFKLDATGQMFHSNHDLFATDNNFDIGASGANRPRSIYWGTQALGPAGTAANPAWSFAGGTNYGASFASGNGAINISLGGNYRFTFLNSELRIGQSSQLSFANGNNDPSGTASDVGARRGGNNIWQITTGNGGTSQGFLSAKLGAGQNTAPIALLTQAASIGTTAIVTGSATTAGTYQVTYYVRVTQAATTSSAIQVTISWNDGTAQTCASSNVTANTVGSIASGICMIKVPASQNISYATTYSSVGGTVMQYSLDVAITQIS